MSADPLFVDADAGDFRLSYDSPCVDAGSNEWIAPDLADVDGDGDTAEAVPWDYAGSFRVGRFTVDMGAYEIPFADVDCDGAVTFLDIAYFVAAISGEGPWTDYYAAHHGGELPPCEHFNADCSGDGLVSFLDIVPFANLLGGA